MKKIWFLLGIIASLSMMVACKKEVHNEKELLPVQVELFRYEVLESVDAIAVDENGFLYTATWIEVEGKERKDSTEEWSLDYQRICVYDLEGNCLENVDVAMGNGTIQVMLIEDGKLYTVINKIEDGPTLYMVDTTTWEATEVVSLEGYSRVERLIPLGEYFYLLGISEFEEDKTYTLHPEVDSYSYSGETVGRIEIAQEHAEVEFLGIDFPIDIFETKDGTLMIYQYTEENGFGFLEFYPQELVFQEAGWKKDNRALDSFSMCEEGFLCVKNGILHYGTVDGKEAQLSMDGALLKNPACYRKGYAFYLNFMEHTVERIAVSDILKDNKEICLLMHETNANKPFGCGYQMKTEELDMEAFSLKLLAGDSDFDMYLLSSRDSNSYNIKEEGVFYPLNEVPWVQEYLDACFPYIKEVAINQDGDIWMLPVGLMVPGLVYDKNYCAEQGVDFSTMDFQQFLEFTEQTQVQAPEKIDNSDYLMVEAFFQQYLKEQVSFDTELFRNYAKQIQTLYKNEEEIVSQGIMPIRNNGVIQGEIPKFIYIYTLYNDTWLRYEKTVEELGEFERIGVTAMPSITEGIGNVGTLTFLAVNPQSENLETTLEYISTLARYIMEQENSFLLADQSTYTDSPFMKECYELYANGIVYFTMDNKIYWDDFFEYLEGNMELEKMIKEIERKREIYVEE